MELSKTGKEVLDCLNEDGGLSAEQIGKKIGKGKRTVERTIKLLKERGIITRVGSDKTGSWKIVK